MALAAALGWNGSPGTDAADSRLLHLKGIAAEGITAADGSAEDIGWMAACRAGRAMQSEHRSDSRIGEVELGACDAGRGRAGDALRRQMAGEGLGRGTLAP